MATLRAVWHFLYHQRAEAAWGLFWALAIWVVFDLLKVGSFVRSVPRRVKNRFAERSAAGLSRRISELQRYRETLGLYLTSDRALYLHTLGFVLGVLVFMCLAGVFMILVIMFPPDQPFPGTIGALGMLTIAIVVGGYGMRLASWDSRAKIHEVAVKIDAEISAMKLKLAERTR